MFQYRGVLNDYCCCSDSGFCARHRATVFCCLEIRSGGLGQGTASCWFFGRARHGRSLVGVQGVGFCLRTQRKVTNPRTLRLQAGKGRGFDLARLSFAGRFGCRVVFVRVRIACQRV